jgi:hydrogenase maturation factor
VRRLTAAGISAAIIGEVVARERGCRRVRRGAEEALVHPRIDPFWEAFGRAASEER